jgi:hypothetical protein
MCTAPGKIFARTPRSEDSKRERKKVMKLGLMIIATFCVLWAIAAKADVYRWVDSQGKVQYSDQPPMGVNAQKMTIKSLGTQPEAGTKSYQEKDQDFRKRKVEQEEQSKKQAQNDQQLKIRQDNCSQAKGHLASLQAGGRIAKVTEKGEREYLDENGIAAAIADAQKAVAGWCK